MAMESQTAEHPTEPGNLRSRLTGAAGTTGFRLLVTIGLLAYVASRIDWGLLGDRIAEASAWSLPAAIALVVAALALGAVRWRILLDCARIRLSTPDLARVYAIGTFSGTFLPTAVGGDVARALLVTRDRARLLRVALTIVVDRTAAVVGLVIVAWVGIAIEPHAPPEGAVTALAVVTAGVVVACLLALWSAGTGGSLLQRMLPGRLHPTARGVRDGIRAYRGHPWALVAVIVLSVAFQLLITLQLLVLADGFGIDLAFGAAAVTLTLVVIATFIPVSIAGFGIREGGYIVILSGVGIGATDATILSLATVAALFVAGLPGAALLVKRGTRPTLS